MGYWFPRFYDLAMLPLERTKFKRIRSALVGKASGRVLEIGSGTGVNFPFYTRATQVDAIEPDPGMHIRLHKRIDGSAVPIKSYAAQAEKLPFADDTFDAIVATLVFCTIPEPEKALQEIKRVAKPEADIFLFEHVRMKHNLLGKMQDLLTPFWKKICDGCHLNRDTLDMVKKAGMSIQKVEQHFKGLFLTIICINEKN